MGQIRKAIITVGGVPWENLTEDYRRRVIKRNTDVAAEIVTREVINMAEKGRSLDEIRLFLNLEKEEIPGWGEM